MDDDDRRREKQSTSLLPAEWNEPLFEPSLERRRLHMLNGLFLALQRCGCRPWIRDKEAHDVDVGVEVGQQNVAFTLERVARRHSRSRPEGATKQVRPARERLAVEGSRTSGGRWSIAGSRCPRPAADSPANGAG